MQYTLVAAFAALAAAAPVEHQRRTDAPLGIKKGLAYNDGGITAALSAPGSATWAYNWGAAQNAPLFQQIPMFWGPGSDAGAVMSAVQGGAPWVLGYNEPDEIKDNGGCNQSPQDALNSWGNDMFQFANAGAKLVCPAVTSWETDAGHTGGPAGLTWLRDFTAGNPGQLRCSAQALHWYGVDGQSGADQAQLFIQYVQHAHSTVNDIFQTDMDLWITEFSPLPVKDANVMADFLRVAIPWLDGQDYVARYSPFMADAMVENGAPNAAGQALIGTS